MLYPENYSYLSDILSYVAIGARSVENQQHRLTVSGMDVPAGMKNPTSGDLSVMLNSVIAAQHPHSFIFRNWEVKTSGNPLSHVILRGADVYKRQQSRSCSALPGIFLRFQADVRDVRHGGSDGAVHILFPHWKA